MKHDAAYQAVDELISLYAAGALPPEEHRSVEERLRQGWPEGQAAWKSLQPGIEAMLLAIPAGFLPTDLKERLLQQLPRAVAVQTLIPKTVPVAPGGIIFQHQRDASFVPTPYPGIAMRLLHLDQACSKFSALLRVAPGAKYPSHHHDGVEECLVLEGTLMVGDTRMVAGDYQRAEAHSDHVDQWSETGALLYINAPLSLLG
ncbi:MAG TPA: cupin domain-containing protein [Gemmatales bacterium]|nr:cupin domain-containing protein [Gemmatales bacterium]